MRQSHSKQLDDWNKGDSNRNQSLFLETHFFKKKLHKVFLELSMLY